ncbi:Oidioi.mRNA.OKI2018_I69.chr2.g4694.t1.cds [Oikopleura dioica]|uniref:Oidioi.mRNA.OKI2018_I69.chr2.g4694.t1.cds n=1 Tax=Oikopleura dioica TaxID=34765 RepID=A0ABN7T3R7_OIKDI|nr:Oidioi.mRNA.OKI2018_I69.chr2.g4694.t1.cds [Oikopleura dioica]
MTDVESASFDESWSDDSWSSISDGSSLDDWICSFENRVSDDHRDDSIPDQDPHHGTLGSLQNSGSKRKNKEKEEKMTAIQNALLLSLKLLIFIKLKKFFESCSRIYISR